MVGIDEFPGTLMIGPPGFGTFSTDDVLAAAGRLVPTAPSSAVIVIAVLISKRFESIPTPLNVTGQPNHRLFTRFAVKADHPDSPDRGHTAPAAPPCRIGAPAVACRSRCSGRTDA